MDRFRKLLENSGADAWEITDTRTTGWEFYFIRHRLDQNRAKNLEQITLKVYKMSEDGSSMGSASAVVAPDESVQNLEKTVRDLVFQASLVKNRPYRLNPPRTYEKIETASEPLSAMAEQFIRTMNGIPESENGYLNSFEIFVSQVERRLINSEGIDITEHYPSSMLDLVVNAKDAAHEIELYRLMNMGGCLPEKLYEEVTKLLSFGRDRLRTVPTPAGLFVPVLLSTDAAIRVYEYFLAQLNASFVVRGMSRFQIGREITENVRGDKITLETKRVLPGSPANFACDPEGAPVRDAVLMKDNIPREFVGNRMFSRYLGLENAFSVSNWAVSGGSRSEAELRSGANLEVVEFSDFQVDSMTGDIFGEIRLAYYRDGKGNVTPVSGGSISGNMAESLREKYLSKNLTQYSNVVIPAVTALTGITITGVE